ncbi:MAG: hypothetical protein FJY85_00415, partial [Deltaproteobacteria bacterium]|nr:hypothetical protein [Deltaproteobacteria bacterium]
MNELRPRPDCPPGIWPQLSSEIVVSILLLVVIIAGVYGPVVTHEFSNWDDPKHMSAIWKPSWERAWKIVTDFDLRYTGVTYYSPMHFLSLMADQVLVGSESEAQAWIAKLMNVAIHVLNTILVFTLFTMMGLGRRAALIGALVFAVHPMQVGTVAWIAERKNLLAASFYLAGTTIFLKYLWSGRAMFALLLVLLFVGGLLSKPSAVTLPVGLLAWVILVPNQRTGGRPFYVLMASLFALAVLWGIYTVRTEVSYEGMLPLPLYRPLLAAAAIWFYLSKFVYPHELVVVYPRWDVEGHALGFLLLFVALVVVVGLLIYWRKRTDTLVLYGLSVFVINVLPVSGLIAFGHMGHSFVADHFFYLPLIGLSLVVARAVEIIDQRLRDRALLRNVALVSMYGL